MTVVSPPALRKLGRSDLMVSALGWGMWRFAGVGVDQARAIIDAVFEAGINFFDTADIYGFQSPEVGFGDAEALLGEVFAAAPSLRHKMVLASKAGITPPTPYNSSAAYLIAACEASLTRMKTDVIDLWQIHRPDLMAHPAEVAEAAERLTQAGKIRAFGVSNYSLTQVRALLAHLTVPLVSFQPEFSPLAIEPLFDGTLDLAMEVDAAVLAWSPLGGGRLAVPNSDDDRVMRVVAVLDRLAQRYGVSRSSIAYAWVNAHPSRPISLVGTQNAARILETREVASVTLTRSDWYEVLVASRGAPMP